MVKYIIIHNKHEGCYDFHYYEDELYEPPNPWLPEKPYMPETG